MNGKKPGEAPAPRARAGTDGAAKVAGGAAEAQGEGGERRSGEDGREPELPNGVTDGADRVLHADRLDGCGAACVVCADRGHSLTAVRVLLGEDRPHISIRQASG